jgi:hypothetical protein
MIPIGFVLAGLSLRTVDLFTPLLPQRVFSIHSGRKIFNKSLRRRHKRNLPPVRSTPESGHVRCN